MTDREALIAKVARAMTHVRGAHNADDGNDGTPCDWCVLAAEQAIEAFAAAGVRLGDAQLHDIDPDPEAHAWVDWDEYEELSLADVRAALAEEPR